MTDAPAYVLMAITAALIVADVVARLSYRHCRHRCCRTYCDCDGQPHRLCCRCQREVTP